MTTPRFELVSSKSCPFAQRTRMALIEKEIPFAFTEISLDAKPDWFLKISPYAKVPLLRDGDVVVYESAVINEYLEEVCPERPLMPTDPAARAQCRIWVDFANVRFIPHVYRLMMAQEDADQQRIWGYLEKALADMEAHLAARGDGPFWLGDKLTLADLSFYPHLERFPAVEHYRGFAIPESCTHLKAWLSMMHGLDSARAVSLGDEAYIRNWLKYARGGGDGTTARDMRAV